MRRSHSLSITIFNVAAGDGFLGIIPGAILGGVIGKRIRSVQALQGEILRPSESSPQIWPPPLIPPAGSMPIENQYLLLTGVKNAERVKEYFSYSMVDVAYVGKISGGSIEIVPDVGIDLENQNDAEWLIGMIADALAACGEANVSMEVHFEH